MPDEPLQIFAAGSLRPAFDKLIGPAPAAVVFTYANARDLEQRIVAGAKADVFASASEEHPKLLHDAGLADDLLSFATNRLVVAVADASPAQDVSVLAAPGTRVVIEVAGIPCGDYTRTMLKNMNAIADAGFSDRAMANVVAQEQVVDAVAAKLIGGQADAGVLYATDVQAHLPQLRAIELPAAAEVPVTLVACVVTATSQHDRARAWVASLESPETEEIMRAAGFGPPPQPAS